MQGNETLDKTLYHIMLNASEDALAALEELNFGEAKRILIDAEQRAEKLYLSTEE